MGQGLGVGVLAVQALAPFGILEDRSVGFRMKVAVPVAVVIGLEEDRGLILVEAVVIGRTCSLGVHTGRLV